MEVQDRDTSLPIIMTITPAMCKIITVRKLKKFASSINGGRQKKLLTCFFLQQFHNNCSLRPKKWASSVFRGLRWLSLLYTTWLQFHRLNPHPSLTWGFVVVVYYLTLQNPSVGSGRKWALHLLDADRCLKSKAHHLTVLASFDLHLLLYRISLIVKATQLNPQRANDLDLNLVLERSMVLGLKPSQARKIYIH